MQSPYFGVTVGAVTEGSD